MVTILIYVNGSVVHVRAAAQQSSRCIVHTPPVRARFRQIGQGRSLSALKMTKFPFSEGDFAFSLRA